MVKAVLLDAYGTLFDTGTGSVQAAQEILARNGREDLSPAEFYGQWKALHHRLMEELPSFRTEARLYAQGLAMLYRQYGFSRNPAEDVKGYMDNKGRNYLCTGYWQVYANPAAKMHLFQKFELARERLIRAIFDGMEIQEVIQLAGG